MKRKNLYRLIFVLFVLVPFIIYHFSVSAEPLLGDSPPEDGFSDIEVISPYLAIVQSTLPDGTEMVGYRINGPPEPPPEYEEERLASILPLPNRGVIASFPSYDWVFGCSAVSGAMIAGYYDNNSYTNMYTGPTNGGVMPLTDTSWSTWYDGFKWYPNNPLIASHQWVDGRTIKGSIDDYWVQYDSSAADPFIGNWTEHTWGSAIGDYMKTSQSSYNSTDGSTWFYNNNSNSKLTCTAMESVFVSDFDGTYGRKEFYEARGYSVNDCYNQMTDNKYIGGFSLADFQAEIDAGHPVLLNLEGHSIVGYGYSGSTIYIRNTWDSNPSNTYTMPWGGSYSGMDLYSVSVVRLNPPSPPAAPTGVSASDGTFADKVRVSWGNPDSNYKIFLPLILLGDGSPGPIPEAPYFQVYRNTINSTDGATQMTSSHPSSPYDDTSAAPGTSYYYWVKACNSAGCSDFSSSDSGYRAGEITIPSPPTGVLASDGTYEDKVMISWTASEGATFYKVFRNSSDSHTGELELTSDHPASPLDDTSAVPETPYYYWVEACNSAGCSGYSSSDTGFRASEITIPSPPTGVSASDGTYSDKVMISWTASEGATFYKVFRNSSDSHTGELELTSDHPSSPYNDTSAISETPYFYWVKACNSADCSDYSNVDSGYRGANTIVNGDFEEGHVGWTEFSSGGYDLIYGGIDWAQSGSWIAYLGGYNDATDQLSQSVTISASHPYLHFWYRIDSEDFCGYDFSYIVVDGDYEAYADLCDENSSSDWAHAVIDLSYYAGRTVSLMFEVVTDSSLISHFFLDTVSMSSSASASMNNGIFIEGTPQNIEIQIKPDG